MINKDSIVTAYDEHLTLVEWLQKVENALDSTSAVSFNVNKRGDATLTFSVVFEDGSEIESNPIILEQGESVNSATISNGHLILTLTNGDELDAGNLGAVSGFNINASQHLIVTYQNGSTQDLGAIFTGDVTLTGSLTAQASIKTPVLTSDEDEISAEKPIVEVMEGYTHSGGHVDVTPYYAGISKNGNKLSIVIAGSITPSQSGGYVNTLLSTGTFGMPADIGNKIVPQLQDRIIGNELLLVSDTNASASSKRAALYVTKWDNTSFTLYIAPIEAIEQGVTYHFRQSITFLLSDNLVSSE